MLLRDGRLIDGVGNVIERGALRIDGAGAIEDVGHLTPDSDETVYDLSGKTVMPGLVDAHVHLSLSGAASIDPVLDASDVELALTEAANARRTLAAGVTAVRTMGARDLDVRVRDHVRRGDIEGPRIVANCRSITITGGHGHHLGREVDGPQACRRAVREEVQRGADFVKFMSTGGVTTPDSDPEALAFTPAEIRTLVDESHRQGVPAATHAHGAKGVKVAARAGVDTVEHGSSLDDEAIDCLRDNDVTLVPTLSAGHSIVENAADAPDETATQNSAVYDRHVDSFRRAYEAGVTIAGGTDAGTPFNYHGENVTELSCMVDNGMDEMDALVAMTSTAAETIGLDDAGRIEPGTQADLLVLDDNPLADLSALRSPETVLQAGEVVAGRPLSRP
jgi:imidazolonepropionase-like amidohydrolase